MDEAPIKLYVMGENRYRYENSWPLQTAVQKKCYLWGEELHKDSAPVAKAAPRTLVHIPPTKQSQMPEDVPVLKYSSPPLEEDTAVVGPVSVTLYVEFSAEDAQLVARLWDKNPQSGLRTLLSTGYLKASRKEITKGKDGRPMHDHTKKQTVVPALIKPYSLEFTPVENVFKKSHVIELEIKTMDQQYFDYCETASLPRLYTSGRVAGPHPMGTEVRYAIYADKEHPSFISLPYAQASEKWVCEEAGQ